MDEVGQTGRGWVWLLRAAGLVLAVVVAANVIDVLAHLVAPARSPVAQRAADVPAVPAAYHPDCVNGQPTLAARVDGFMERMLAGQLRGSEGAGVRCHKCGEPISDDSQIVLLGR